MSLHNEVFDIRIWEVIRKHYASLIKNQKLFKDFF